MRVNLLLQLVVAFLPFPTSVVGEAVRIGTGEQAAVLFYGDARLLRRDASARPACAKGGGVRPPDHFAALAYPTS
jgi:hypothetical protein